MHAELTESGVPFTLGATTELAVYRLVQEGLTNAVKHAGPRARVAVVLSWQPEALIVAVVDDGGEVPMPMPVPGARDRCRPAGDARAGRRDGRDVQRGAR